MQNTVPLVSISVLQPFVNALRQAGVDPRDALALLGFRGEPSAYPERLVHTNLVNRFLEKCADISQDPQFCSRVGARLDPEGWPMIHAALDRAKSLAEFVSIYIDGANRVASSVDTYLEVRGASAAFGQKRIAKPDILPSQNDAFMASLFVAMIRQASGANFDPSKVQLRVCDPKALTEDIRQCRVMRGNSMGHRVQFPTEWLAATTNATKNAADQADVFRKDLLSTLRLQLQQHVGSGPLRAPDVADLCGLSLSRLKRALAQQGTSIAKELDRAKLDYAREHLVDGTQSLHDIAMALGYSDPSNFTRWFRSITGQSPSKYRAGFHASRVSKEH